MTLEWNWMFKQIIPCVTGLLWNVNTIDNKHLFYEKKSELIGFWEIPLCWKALHFTFYFLAASKSKAFARLWKLSVWGIRAWYTYINSVIYLNMYIYIICSTSCTNHEIWFIIESKRLNHHLFPKCWRW